VAGKNEFSFDEFAKLCPNHRIEHFRDRYGVLFDMNGVVHSHTVGFHFTLNDAVTGEGAKLTEMVKLFQPVAIWAGSEELQQQLSAMGYMAKRFPYFEDGGFMVVLKVPVARSARVSGDSSRG